MYCSKCGGSLTADAAFCGGCGTPVGRPAPVAAAPPVTAGYPLAAAGSTYADPAGLVISRSFVYAGIWLRFFAYLIDGLILTVAILILLLPFLFLTGLAASIGTIGEIHGQPNAAQVGAFITLILFFVAISILIQWLYHAYLESGEKQATWGKQALGIYVTDLMGNRLSFGRASGRFFAKIVTGMIPLGIGYIMAGFTERKQALHDMIASCLVLKR